MSFLYLSLAFFFLFAETNGQDEASRFFPVGIDGANPIVSAVLNSSNISVFCEVVNSNNDVVLTEWSLTVSGEQPDFFLFTADGIGQTGYENYLTTPLSEFRRNLTIIVFDGSFDNTQIGCGRGGDIYQRFYLRIIKLPILLQAAVSLAVSEFSPFTFTIESTSGFPIVPDSYQWSINSAVDIPDDNVNPNVSVYPNITFTSVSRNDSGNYSLTVSNEAGTTTGFFVLDVQFKPEGVVSTGPYYVVAGDDITITSFTDIDGNPVPNSAWSFGGQLLTDSNQYNTSIPGQLTIISVELSDASNYTNTLTNNVAGDDMSIDNTVELIVAAPPSMPRNVTILNTGATYVNISWVNPSDLGVQSTLSQFRISVMSDVINVTLTVDATDINNPSFTNMALVNGLKPAVEYTVTVQAISTVEQLMRRNISSLPSEPVQFNTTVGAPGINTADLSNINGNLSVSWSFLFTGGSSLLRVTVQCSSTVDSTEDLSASADPLAMIVECATNEEDCFPGGSVSVGPITAGLNYSCLITAENGIGGTDESRTNYIIATTGIPSLPVITNVVGGAGSATITLRVDSYGVSSPNDFSFIVSVFLQSNTATPIDIRMIMPDSIASPVVSIIVDGLAEGVYVFTVASSNFLDIPSTATNITTANPATVRPMTSTSTITRTTLPTGPTTTSTSTSTTPGRTRTTTSDSPTMTVRPERNTDGISGGAIAGIIIAVIIILAIVAIVVFIVIYIVYQNRGGSYKVEKSGRVVVEEHDIDIGTELQSTKSGAVAEQEKKPFLATSSTTPAATASPDKGKLIYADLAEFSQPKTQTPTASTAKPMPIEEVQYAVIRPQDQKPPTNPSSSAATSQ